MAFFVDGQMRVKTTPYVIPHSSNMPEAMVKNLTKSYSQVIKLKSQVVVAKALGAQASMREMKATEKAYASANVPLKTTAHGTIVPSTQTAKILQTQGKVLTGAINQTSVVSTGYLEKTARTDILTTKVHGLFDEISGLKQELREAKAPVVVVQKSLFGDLGLGLPSFAELKKPLLIAGIVAAAALFLPSIIGAFKK